MTNLVDVETQVSVKTDMMSFLSVEVTGFDKSLQHFNNKYSCVLYNPIREEDVFAFSVDCIINDKHQVSESLIDDDLLGSDVREFQFSFKQTSQSSGGSSSYLANRGFGRVHCKDYSRKII